MLGAAGEPALLHDLPPPAWHGLPAASAHAAQGEGPAPVPAAAQHTDRHMQGEGGPGGPGALSPGRETGREADPETGDGGG